MKLFVITLIAAFLLSTTAFAQRPESNRTIHQRKFDQQARVRQGVRSGQLTGRETRHVEHQERAIHRETRDMRAADNGHLTRSDRRAIASQQNQESNRIYRDKHNAQVR